MSCDKFFYDHIFRIYMVTYYKKWIQSLMLQVRLDELVKNCGYHIYVLFVNGYWSLLVEVLLDELVKNC